MKLINPFKKQQKQNKFIEVKYSKLDHIGKVKRYEIPDKSEIDNQINNVGNQINDINNQITQLTNKLNNVETKANKNEKYIKQYVFFTDQDRYADSSILNIRKINNDFFGFEFNTEYNSGIWSLRFESSKFKARYYFYQLFIKGFTWNYRGVYKTWYIQPILIKQGETVVNQLPGLTPQTEWIRIFNTNEKTKIPRGVIGMFNKNFVEVDNIDEIKYAKPIIEVVFLGKEFSDY